MSKFVNVPRPAPQIGNDFLQQQLDQQAAQQPVPELTAEAGVPTPTPGTYGGSSRIEVPEPTEQDYREQELFSDDIYGDQGPDYTGQVYQDAELGMGREVADAEGNTLPLEELARYREQTIQQQAEGPRLMQDVARAKSEDDLRASFPKAFKETDIGGYQRASYELGRAMINTEFTDSSGNTTTAATKLADGLGVTTRSAANYNTLAMTMLAPMLKGSENIVEGQLESDLENEAEIQDAYSAAESLFGDDGEGALELGGFNGGILEESLETAAGRMILGFSKAAKAVDPEGRPLDPTTQDQTRIDSKEAGVIHVQSGIDAGYYSRTMKDGVPVIHLTHKGTDFYRSSRQMQSLVTNKLYSRAQKVPVQDRGEYIGATRSIKGKDLQKKNYQAIEAGLETNRIFGSIGKLSSLRKGYFGAQMFKNLLNKIEDPMYQDPMGFDALAFFKIDPQLLEDYRAEGGAPGPARVVLHNKLNGIASELWYQAGFMQDGTPNYTKYKRDYSSGRVYQDPIDFNEQRNKFTRAIMNFSSPSFKMDVNSKFHETGVSLKDANQLWTDIGNRSRDNARKRPQDRDWSMSAKERELSFLATVARTLDIGTRLGAGRPSKTENMTMPEMLSLVDRGFLLEAAFVGEQLRSLVPNNKNAVVTDLLNVATKVDEQRNDGRKKLPGKAEAVTPEFDGIQLTPAQVQAMSTWLNGSERETWGYTLQAYLDVADYMDAKKNNTAFNPKVTVALDMNSAGRAFLAMDVGAMDVLDKVGLVWNMTDREYQDVGANGDPRAYFTRVAKDQGIKAAFGDSDPDKVTAWTNLLEEFGGSLANKDSARKFNSALAKKVLMTTDYGKAMQYHIEEARAFLKAYPEFQKRILAEYNGDIKAVVKDLNDIFFSTLRMTTDSWQYTLPKNIVKVLQMAGRTPEPNGFWDEKMSVGNFGSEETGQFFELKSNGNTRRIAKTKAVFDPEAAARKKTLIDENDKPISYVPGPGTAALNQMGPIMGQYRESVVISETAAILNGGKDPAKMLNLSPVFDNFIVDAQSYLWTMYVANNIVVPSVLKWDMAKSIEDDFRNQMKEMSKELKQQGTTITISPKSKYKGAMTVLDREYNYIKDKKDSELYQNQRDLKNYLESSSSGYITPDNRPETFMMQTAQLERLIGVVMPRYFGMTKTDKSNGRLNDWTNPLSKWRKQREEALERMLAHARRGEIYFFT
jgi:hypothetical protein